MKNIFCSRIFIDQEYSSSNVRTEYISCCDDDLNTKPLQLELHKEDDAAR